MQYDFEDDIHLHLQDQKQKNPMFQCFLENLPLNQLNEKSFYQIQHPPKMKAVGQLPQTPTTPSAKQRQHLPCPKIGSQSQFSTEKNYMLNLATILVSKHLVDGQPSDHTWYKILAEEAQKNQ